MVIGIRVRGGGQSDTQKRGSDRESTRCEVVAGGEDEGGGADPVIAVMVVWRRSYKGEARTR